MDILKQYRDIISSAIDEKGVYPAHALVLSHDDKVTMMALDLSSTQSYGAFLKAIRDEKAKEAIFALDRSTLPNQGTKYADVLAGQYYVGGEFRPFIIEYQHEPRIVDPLVWDNEFWTGALTRELVAHRTHYGL